MNCFFPILKPYNYIYSEITQLFYKVHKSWTPFTTIFFTTIYLFIYRSIYRKGMPATSKG